MIFDFRALFAMVMEKYNSFPVYKKKNLKTPFLTLSYYPKYKRPFVLCLFCFEHQTKSASARLKCFATK